MCTRELGVEVGQLARVWVSRLAMVWLRHGVRAIVTNEYALTNGHIWCVSRGIIIFWGSRKGGRF